MKTLFFALTFGILFSCTAPSTKKEPVELTSLPKEFQLLQRNFKVLPSTSGNVEVMIGDITGGQTWLTISVDSVDVFEKSIHEGDTLLFAIDKKKYHIICTAMINNLIGDDVANFKVE